MKELKFENLYAPEYYHEIQGFDSRLAVLKLNDLRETLGDAAMSILYSDKEEQNSIENTFEKDVIRRVHIRHAIIDLNNAFDLLLQIPWFFYRIWTTFNNGGQYHEPRNNNYTDVVRNTENWVETAERMCSYARVIQFLSNHDDQDLVDMAQAIELFKKSYIFNRHKDFTIRTLANSIKHNGSLKIKELRQPWNFRLRLNEYEVDLKEKGLALKISREFYELEDEIENFLGRIHMEYSDDLYIDVEYNNGESFYGKDYAAKSKHYGLDELHAEAVDCYDNIITLFEKVLSNISTKLALSPLLKIDGIKASKNNINLDKYFKTNE